PVREETQTRGSGRGRSRLIFHCLSLASQTGFPSEKRVTQKPFLFTSFLFSRDRSLGIDGMKLGQTRAILNYMAPKYDLCGRDLKERALIDMYTEGMADLNEMIIALPLCPPDQKDAKIALIKERTTDRYLPVFEKVLKSHGQDYLVGNTLSRADIHLVELLYYVEEIDPSLLANFPLVKALKTRISNLPTVKKFLQPGSPRKPPIDEKSLEQARQIFRVK
uniref:glutathione transferase n=2 Tax=Ursus maritimus TaxID=29073 RepID=A0A452TBK1_URSMA